MEILGIQIDRPYIRAALIQKNRKGFEIRNLQSALLSEPENVKPLYIHNFKGRIATGLSSNDFLIRSLELKIGDHRDIEEAIAFQFDATSHFNPNEILTVPIVRKKREGKTEALLFTASKEAISSHLRQFEKLEIDPDGVSSTCTALCRFLEWKVPELSNAIIIDLGSHEWTCVVKEDGQLKKAHAIPGGVESLFSSLWEDRKKILLQKEIKGIAKQIDLLQLKSHLNPHLSQKLRDFQQELSKVIHSFQRNESPKPIIFTGCVDAFVHLREFLLENFKEIISEESINCLSPDEQKYAVSLGLALEFASCQSLQFRRKEFFPLKNWKRLGTYALTLFGASIVISSLLFCLIHYQDNIRKSQMIDFLQVSLDRWDPTFKTKIIQKTANEEEILENWIHAVDTNNKEYACIRQAPRVAEVLSWLDHHPVVEALKKEGDPLILREIRYQLVQFPKIGSMQEPYLAKVDLEFQVQGAIGARKFHEALLQGDSRVNPNLEITWETLSDCYRTSFYLKNRSPNVP